MSDAPVNLPANYWGWIEKFLSPSGVKKTNYGRLYRLLGSLADSYAEDRVWLLRQHFALSCEVEYLERLGRIFALPRWSFESDEGYRERLIAAGFELEAKGTIRQFRWFMNGLFGAGDWESNWESNGEAPEVFAVSLSAVGDASVNGIDVLRVGIKAVNAFTVGTALVGKEVVGGVLNTTLEQELRRFLDWFLAVDIAYEVYFL